MERLGTKGECPECGAPIDITEKDIEEQRKTLKRLKKTLMGLEQYLREIVIKDKAYLNYEKRLHEYNKSQNELASIHIEDTAPLQERLDELSELDSEQKTRYLKAQQEKEQVITHNAKIRERQKRREEAQIELAHSVDRENELKEKIRDIDILLEICDKVIVEKQIPERLNILEKFINLELSNFTSQYKIKLEMLDSKIKPTVVKLGKAYPYKNCSQGERGRINLALLLAIRSILTMLKKEIPNILFIDELLNIIDAGGKQIIVDTLNELEINSFIVCHDFVFDVPQLVLIKEDNKTWIGK